MSQAVTIVSGHNGTNGDVDWAALAASGATLVLLLAVAARAAIADALVAGGLPVGTSVLAVEWGSTPAERRVVTTLGALGTVQLKAPAVIVIGAVADLADPSGGQPR